MAEQKTKPTKVSVTSFIDAIDDETRRDDCRAIIKMMKEITGEEPKMWGPSIIGFGTYHYKYASGHEGYSCVTGFSPRKPALTIYIMMGLDKHDELMAKLGKYKASKACLYIKRLEDIDMKVLTKLVRLSVEFVRKTYPDKK